MALSSTTHYSASLVTLKEASALLALTGRPADPHKLRRWCRADGVTLHRVGRELVGSMTDLLDVHARRQQDAPGPHL